MTNLVVRNKTNSLSYNFVLRSQAVVRLNINRARFLCRGPRKQPIFLFQFLKPPTFLDPCHFFFYLQSQQLCNHFFLVTPLSDQSRKELPSVGSHEKRLDLLTNQENLPISRSLIQSQLQSTLDHLRLYIHKFQRQNMDLTGPFFCVPHQSNRSPNTPPHLLGLWEKEKQ